MLERLGDQFSYSHEELYLMLLLLMSVSHEIHIFLSVSVIYYLVLFNQVVSLMISIVLYY